MSIKTIPLSRLEADLKATLNECADSGEPIVVQLPDDRLVTIQSLDSSSNDSLVDELIASSPEFREMISKSRNAPRRPFAPR